MQKNQKRMIVWTAALVALMSVVSFFVLLQPPTNLPPIAREKSTRLRQPASITASEETVKMNSNEKNQAVEVTVSCDGENSIQLPAGVSQVRLIGSLCLPGKNSIEILSSEIRNELNGFSATVFYPKARTFTTDYMTIASGENHIKIVHQLGKYGREAREFTVRRD